MFECFPSGHLVSRIVRPELSEGVLPSGGEPRAGRGLTGNSFPQLVLPGLLLPPAVSALGSPSAAHCTGFL